MPCVKSAADVAGLTTTVQSQRTSHTRHSGQNMTRKHFAKGIAGHDRQERGEGSGPMSRKTSIRKRVQRKRRRERARENAANQAYRREEKAARRRFQRATFNPSTRA